jgi:hypothetical protein
MSLFNSRKAIENVKEARAAKPKKLDHFQQLVTDNKVLRDELAHLRAKTSQHDSRIASLESFQSGQETFNVGTQERVGKLQRNADAAGVPCVGCGQPANVGVHSVACFTTAGE